MLAAALMLLSVGLGTVQAKPLDDVTSVDSSVSSSGSDPQIPTLTWAPIKTGFRAVVAWTSPGLALGEVSYQVGSGETVVLKDDAPRRTHVFILRDLPKGEDLTFTASHTFEDGSTVTSDAHTFTLGNAMNAYDEDAGAYTINLLVLANENLLDRQVEAIEDGMRDYAEDLWDASDGHVRAGTTIIVRGDLEHHDSGFFSCGGFTVGPVMDLPSCHHLADYVWTYDHGPVFAGVTQKGAIAQENYPVYMNNVWETETPFGDDVGKVVLHELGHYAFWMDDLYNLAGDTCYDPGKDISIMGSSRAPTEFDGPNAPCSNGDTFGDYTPSWTYLRNHYPEVPSRSTGPDDGPSGDGGAFSLHTFDLSVADARVDPWNDVVRGSVQGDAGADYVAVSGTGTARSTWAAASGTGGAEARAAASAAGPAEACTQFSLLSPCTAVSGTDDATGVVAVSGLGDASSCPAYLTLTPCVAVSGGGDATAGRAAVSVLGSAECTSSTCVEVEVVRTLEDGTMSATIVDLEPGSASDLHLP